MDGAFSRFERPEEARFLVPVYGLRWKRREKEAPGTASPRRSAGACRPDVWRVRRMPGRHFDVLRLASAGRTRHRRAAGPAPRRPGASHQFGRWPAPRPRSAWQSWPAPGRSDPVAFVPGARLWPSIWRPRRHPAGPPAPPRADRPAPTATSTQPATSASGSSPWPAPAPPAPERPASEFRLFATP